MTPQIPHYADDTPASTSYVVSATKYKRVAREVILTYAAGAAWRRG